MDITTADQSDIAELLVVGHLIVGLEHATGLIELETADIDQLSRLVSVLEVLSTLVPSDGVGTLFAWAAHAGDVARQRATTPGSGI